MGQRKIFLTDVDGTLDYQGRGITEPVICQARQFIADGGRLGLATGRALVSTEKIAGIIGINAPSILYGGSMVYDFVQKKPLWLCPLHPDVLTIARAIIRQYSDVALQVCTDLSIHILNANDMLWQKGIAEERDKRFCNDRVKGRLLKLSLCGDSSLINAIYDQFFARSDFNFAFSSRHFAEVVGKDAGKGKAMQVIAEMTGLSLEQFIVMGDAQNDLELMQLAGFSYALGNAIPQVKAAADVILPHCEADGAAEGFRHARQHHLHASC